eukprot:UN1292
MAISGGDDWRNFVECFKREPAWGVYVTLFSIYIAFATMVMANLVTGYFVDGAQKMMNAEEEDHLIRLAAKIFMEADKDQSETISLEEFEELVGTGMLDDWFAALGFGLQEADRLFSVIDEDDSGSLTLSEFVRGCLRLKGSVKACDLALMKHNLRLQAIDMVETARLVEDLASKLAEVLPVVQLFSQVPNKLSKVALG